MPFELSPADLPRILPAWMVQHGAHLAEQGVARIVERYDLGGTTSYEGRVGRWTIYVDLSEREGVSVDCDECGKDGCVHAAAILHLIAHGATSATGLRPPSGLVEPWRRALERALDDPGVAEPTDVALLIGLDRDGVQIRPGLRGTRGTWIRTGIGWRDLDGKGITAEQRRALGELEALHEAREHFPGSTRPVYRSRWGSYDRAPQWIRLDELPSRGLWGVLADLRDAGVHLVADTKAQSPVALRAEPAAHHLSLDRRDGALHVRPVIDLQTEDDVRILPVGVPVAALAIADDDGVRELVPLREPLADAFTRLMQGEAFTIPDEAVADFERDYLPKLRRVAPLRSEAGTYDIPAPARPTLVLTLAQAEARATLSWRWEYPDASGLRLPAEERAIGDAVEAAAGERRELLGARQGTGFGAAMLTKDETVEFRTGVLPALRGVDGVRVDETDEQPEYRFAADPPVVHVSTAPHGNDWFDLEVSVDVGGEAVPLGMLLTALVARDRYVVLPSGTVFTLNATQFDPLRELLEEARSLQDRPTGPLRISRWQTDLWEELVGIGLVQAQANDWLDRLRGLTEADRLEPVEVPPGFRAQLRDYQKAGLAWLDFLRRHRLGGILADDMGLGKTVQVLAALERARQEDPSGRYLVVAPTSVVSNWVSEAARFAPALPTVGMDETSGKRGTALAEAVGDARLVVTSYALFRLDFDEYQAMGFTVLVLDEAQQIKNHRAQTHRCARVMDVPSKFAITGTPLENNLLELWALASLVAPGLLGGERSFTDQYRKPIERERNGERLHRLRRRLRPFMLRRTKEEVASDLPEKTEQLLEVELHPAHRRAYATRLQRERQKVLGLLDDVEANRMEILRSLTTLRLLALDPDLVDGAGSAPSAKLEKLGELLEEIVGDGHSVLVFSQFTQFLGRAAAVADARGIPYAYLDGSVSMSARKRMIERFTGGDVPVFFISLKAGGFGLNLTQADYCILLDPWWNPAAEAQATDRAHRIGQTRPVVVYRLISKGTIESKVVAMQEKKSRLFRDVLAGDDPSSVGALSATDFRGLIEG
ncbi:DEAD/DEAH box helicase [Microbacterium paludicola]|uniref:DEAD/DEAH box helicase n=1 Tax=Microbacterium paludicola TaxID=300019 RepID=A0A4Y9FVP5_9MICO|nr:DEAD/DEAH box helicase [Microbacterium paludicola]MBF0816987.1 DEAD/DEAH box helicase [Microbacterium paludicola]TFU32299.1 DEAD/DEAH box helicase [Microbacterium paludicola]